MKNKLIIFDLDGVLVDSIENMRISLNQTAKSLNLNLNFKEYKKFLGLPFEKIMNKMGINEKEEIIKKKYIYFSKKNLKKIKIKKKILLDLKSLKKKYKLAVYTSKDKIRSHKILKKYKIIDFILTSDDVLKGKPNPEGIKKILKKMNINKKNTIYIGDSYYDYLCSKRAGVKYCHVTWGYDKMKNIKKLVKINNLKKIEKFL